MYDFLKKVDKIGNCWIWLKRKDKNGYGRVKIKGKTFQAHRASWQLFVGKIPEGLCVLHHCDNPSCVNPRHLFLGTTLDNMRDRDAKGRNGYSKRTHCPQGHEYSAKNTIIWRRTRKCRTCKKEYDARRAG